MRFVVIGDTYPPAKSSAALQLSDLCFELASQGHQVTVFVPDPSLKKIYAVQNIDGVTVVRFWSLKIKDIGYVRRSIGEMLMPITVCLLILFSKLRKQSFDGIIWYSPSIFFGLPVALLKKYNSCKAYLILRDLFPDWAFKSGLIKRGLPYFFFKLVARYQYNVADWIGVESVGASRDLLKNGLRLKDKIEVLHNWLSRPNFDDAKFDIDSFFDKDTFVFAYTGNVGIAQDFAPFIEAAAQIRHRRDIAFVIAGRGSSWASVKSRAEELRLDQVVFLGELEPRQVSSLLFRADAGIVSLARNHSSHSVPGKFVNYISCELPVFAYVNHDNDLIKLINTASVGLALSRDDDKRLSESIVRFVDSVCLDSDYSLRCKELYYSAFTPSAAANQLVSKFQEK